MKFITVAGVVSAASFLTLSEVVVGKTYFEETFSDLQLSDRWVHSSWKENMGVFKHTHGDSWTVDPEIEKGIQAAEDAKFYGISSKFAAPFSNKEEDLVLQFSVKNVEKPSSFCGGGYIKLLPADHDQAAFGGDSPYYVMFGPDICGYDVSRIHVILNYKGENLLKTEDVKLNHEDKNDLTHLYTLVIRPDKTYEVFFDQESRASGSLYDAWAFPQKQIPDPSDKKPEEWVEVEMMDDPADVKPEGWDDMPLKIADPDATMPDDWDEEDDGEWEAPMIDNPEYKGEWKPKQIVNPDYKGDWVQKTMENPDFDENVHVFENIGAVGFELWIVNSGSIFDNIYVGNSLEEANKMASETWGKIKDLEKEAKETFEEKMSAFAKALDEEGEDDSVDLDDLVEAKQEL